MRMIRLTDKYILFYKEWPSNFRRTDFVYSFDGGEPKRFFCTEQAFMYCKAMFFHDEETDRMILDAPTPMDAKNLGRRVRNYVDSEWDKVRYVYMRDVNLERFRQDEVLRKLILNPEYDGLEFVEASPVDLIWGVGMEKDDPLIDDDRNWKGRNLLGKALTEVRKIIKGECTR